MLYSKKYIFLIQDTFSLKTMRKQGFHRNMLLRASISFSSMSARSF